MWGSKAALGLLSTLLITACGLTTPPDKVVSIPQPSATFPNEFVTLEPLGPNDDPWERPPWVPNLPKGKENTVFEIEPAANAGVFHAFLRNDEGLFSLELHKRFVDLLNAYCRTNAVMVTDVVIITADERWPSRYTEGLFRCEEAQQ